MVRATLVFGLLAVLPRMAPAQAQPDVREILKQVSATYKPVTQYELVARAVSTSDPEFAGKTFQAHFAFRAPSRYLFEGSAPGLTTEFGEALFVHDGSTLWIYLPEKKLYISQPARELTPDAPGDMGDMAPAAMDGFMTWRYRGAADFAEATFLREEPIEFGGASVPCHVLTVSQKKGAMVYTWWVDKQRHWILREDNAGSSTVFTSIKLGQPLSDSLFQFKPPPGARKLDIPK